MALDKKAYRVVCISNLVGAVHSDEPLENSLTYCYVSTLEEAKAFARTISEKGYYQSEFTDNHNIVLDYRGAKVDTNIPNPSVAVIEKWDEDEQDWLCYLE